MHLTQRKSTRITGDFYSRSKKKHINSHLNMLQDTFQRSLHKKSSDFQLNHTLQAWNPPPIIKPIAQGISQKKNSTRDILIKYTQSDRKTEDPNLHGQERQRLIGKRQEQNEMQSKSSATHRLNRLQMKMHLEQNAKKYYLSLAGQKNDKDKEKNTSERIVQILKIEAMKQVRNMSPHRAMDDQLTINTIPITKQQKAIREEDNRDIRKQEIKGQQKKIEEQKQSYKQEHTKSYQVLKQEFQKEQKTRLQPYRQEQKTHHQKPKIQQRNQQPKREATQQQQRKHETVQLKQPPKQQPKPSPKNLNQHISNIFLPMNSNINIQNSLLPQLVNQPEYDTILEQVNEVETYDKLSHSSSRNDTSRKEKVKTVKDPVQTKDKPKKEEQKSFSKFKPKQQEDDLDEIQLQPNRGKTQQVLESPKIPFEKMNLDKAKEILKDTTKPETFKQPSKLKHIQKQKSFTSDQINQFIDCIFKHEGTVNIFGQYSIKTKTTYQGINFPWQQVAYHLYRKMAYERERLRKTLNNQDNCFVLQGMEVPQDALKICLEDGQVRQLREQIEEQSEKVQETLRGMYQKAKAVNKNIAKPSSSDPLPDVRHALVLEYRHLQNQMNSKPTAQMTKRKVYLIEMIFVCEWFRGHFVKQPEEEKEIKDLTGYIRKYEAKALSLIK